VSPANAPDPTTARALGLDTLVFDDDTISDLLQRVVLLARHSVGRAHSVSITVPDGEGYRTTNSTEDEALAIDEAQYAGGRGPCLEALREAHQVHAIVGGEGDRWPMVDELAMQYGVTAVLSTPLIERSPGAIGSLNIYCHQDGAFTEDDLRTAEMLGAHAAILLDNALELKGAAKLNDQLREALASREIIGEAKGIIMERQSCSRDEAFDILRRASQRENRKLRDLAEELVARVEARRHGSSPDNGSADNGS